MIYALAQKRVHKKTLGALLHLLLFSGFVVLTIGTTLLAIADDGPYNFTTAGTILIYELTMDVFGVAFISAVCWQCIAAPSAGSLAWVITGVNRGSWGYSWPWELPASSVEALRMHYTQVQPWLAHWSVIGWLIDMSLLRGIGVPDRAGDAPRWPGGSTPFFWSLGFLRPSRLTDSFT